MIDLCVINFNTVDKVKRLYETYAQSAYQIEGCCRFYYADNGSTDGSVELFKTLELVAGDVTYNENIGYAAACNQLAAKGTGDIIGLLNADVWFTQKDIIAIQKSFDENPDQAIMGPKQRDERGYVTHAGIEGDEVHPKLRGWKSYDPENVYYRDYKEMVSVSGSAYFIRRSVWDELTACAKYKSLHPEAAGAFLPTPHYYEETFCSYHARFHGHKIYYDGRISIGHSWHASHDADDNDKQLFLTSRSIFRQACDYEGIEHD